MLDLLCAIEALQEFHHLRDIPAILAHGSSSGGAPRPTNVTASCAPAGGAHFLRRPLPLWKCGIHSLLTFLTLSDMAVHLVVGAPPPNHMLFPAAERLSRDC